MICHLYSQKIKKEACPVYCWRSVQLLDFSFFAASSTLYSLSGIPVRQASALPRADGLCLTLFSSFLILSIPTKNERICDLLLHSFSGTMLCFCIFILRHIRRTLTGFKGCPPCKQALRFQLLLKMAVRRIVVPTIQCLLMKDCTTCGERKKYRALGGLDRPS